MFGNFNLPAKDSQAEAHHPTATWSYQDRVCLTAGLGIALVTFAIDLSTTRGVAAGVFPHFLAIGVAAWSIQRWMPFGLALLASAFTLIGFALTEGGRFDVVLINRLFLIASYWLVAYLVFLKQSVDLQLRQSLQTQVERSDRRGREVVEGESRLRIITDRLPALVAHVGSDERYRFVNKAYREMAALPLDQIIGRSVRDVLGEATYQVVKGNIDRVLSGEVVRSDVELPTGEGVRNFQVSYVPEQDRDGKIAGFILLAFDVTDELVLQQQLQQTQKLEAIGQLSGGIAHDFNNLLGVIQGNVEMASLHAGAEERPYLDAAQRATERGISLISRLLAFARRQPMDPTPTDVAEVVGSMEELLKRSLGETIRVKFSSPDALWTVMADGHQLEAAVLNLALNARDAMPQGGTLRVEMQNVTLEEEVAPGGPPLAPNDYVVLSVCDNGLGMSQEVLEHAFEPFFTTKGVGEGSGLGLSMVYGFAKQSGGAVVIDSRPGEGTTVHLYLPRTVAEIEASPQEITGASVPGPMGEPLAVLLVEDDAAMRLVVASMLEQLNCTVEPCENAEQVLQALGKRRFDLLLSDIVLAEGQNGYDIASQAMARCPDLPVVLMSGNADSVEGRSGHAQGNWVVLKKPFRLQQLAAAIEPAQRALAR